MPFTRLQARDRIIMNSLAQFLDRNVKQAYDIEAAATIVNPNLQMRYVKPLTITIGKPDDITVVRKAPTIAIAEMPSGEGNRQYEIGSAVIWRHRSYLLTCFPSLDANGTPCDLAHQLLRSYMQEAFETECVSVLDQSNPLFGPGNVIFAQDVMYIRTVSDPIDRGQVSALAEEKHRFDIRLSVKFAVIGSLAT